ncbi:hypothetical protein BGZ59_002288 [Podila verticillata]|nr:hypothetical protein BGZ59_002288 [Podila verticillata]
MASSKTNRKPTVTEKDVEWFNSSNNQTPEAFFNHLKTTDRKKAHLRYNRVLRDYDASDAYRKSLMEEFESWGLEEADAYWEERVALKSVKSAQIRAATTLVRTSEPFAFNLMESNVLEAQAAHTISSSTEGNGLTMTLVRTSEPFAESITLEAQAARTTSTSSTTSTSIEGNEDTATEHPPRGSKRSSASSTRAAPDSPTKKPKKSKQNLAVDRRSERFHSLDQSRFWRLSNGKVVEETLYRASLEYGASTSVRSYTIDTSCPKTQALFTSQEWDEVVSSVSFLLPGLHKKTLNFIEKLRRSLCENKHPYTVPLPDATTMSDADRFDCNLAVKTVVEWHMLYTKEPSPFVVDDLSESWWARTAWALLFNLLDDIPSIFMVDREKRGLDSSKRRNMGRAYIPEEPKHKKCGRKLDLICRDEVLRHDWLVVERMRGWDPQSTKFLREYSHDVVRETATIAHNRLFDVPTSFRKECTFVGAYTGSRGIDAFQMKPGPGHSYVLLMQPIGQYTLCPMNGELKEQFQGLVRLLQIRASMRNTIELYNSLIGSAASTTVESPESDDENLDWYYGEPEPRFDPNQVVSSSPIGPDDLSDLDEHPSDANDM